MPSHAQTRYAAGLEKMSTLDIPATFGEVAKNEWAKALNEWVKFGRHVYMTHNVVWNNGKWHKEPVQIDDETHPEKFAKLTDNQQYWTNRWGDQMNYRYWKDRTAGRDDRRGRPGPAALLRGDDRLQERRLSPRPSRSSARACSSGKNC